MKEVGTHDRFYTKLLIEVVASEAVSLTAWECMGGVFIEKAAKTMYRDNVKHMVACLIMILLRQRGWRLKIGQSNPQGKVDNRERLG